MATGQPWVFDRYTGISAEQASAVRRRWLVSNYVLGTMHGGYWGIRQQRHFRHLITPAAPPFALPHPRAADSDRAFEWLDGSDKRKLPFGRGFFRRG